VYRFLCRKYKKELVLSVVIAAVVVAAVAVAVAFAVILMGRWWRWALVSPDGVAPSRIVASVNLSCTIKSRSSHTRVVLEKGP